MHFGRGPEAVERKKERSLLACLEAYVDEIDHLYLLGDVFDGYIEYRHLVPKGFVRFQGLLARWTDRGIPVTYLLGNHDPWHLTHFSEELGVTLVPEGTKALHFGRSVYLAHGDALTASGRARGWLRSLLRHPLSARLYRTLLPANLGLRTAQWMSRRLHDSSTDARVADTLRNRARSLLRRNSLDAVVLAHSHVPALHNETDGVYANTGNWYEQRTFVRLDKEGFHLQRWNGARAQDIESVPF